MDLSETPDNSRNIPVNRLGNYFARLEVSFPNTPTPQALAIDLVSSDPVVQGDIDLSARILAALSFDEVQEFLNRLPIERSTAWLTLSALESTSHIMAKSAEEPEQLEAAASISSFVALESALQGFLPLAIDAGYHASTCYQSVQQFEKAFQEIDRLHDHTKTRETEARASQQDAMLACCRLELMTGHFSQAARIAETLSLRLKNPQWGEASFRIDAFFTLSQVSERMGNRDVSKTFLESIVDESPMESIEDRALVAEAALMLSEYETLSGDLFRARNLLRWSKALALENPQALDELYEEAAEKLRSLPSDD